MTADEIIDISKIAVKCGVKSVKLTGGEPLLRDDLSEIVSGLAKLHGIEDISMVSNGRLLTFEKAEILKAAGLTRVNISIPSIRDEVYRSVTGAHFADAVEGMDNAIQVGLNPIKVNMVLLKDINEGEMWEAIEFARKKRIYLQFIELEPIGLSEDVYARYHFPLTDIVKELEHHAQHIKIRTHMHSRRIYSLDGVNVEVVKPIENTEFCLHCTRIRLTHDGKLKPCLMRNDNNLDILTPLRKGVPKEELEQLFIKAVELREPYWKGVPNQS
jgi:cyclic pyranopterin phosphate synthase